MARIDWTQASAPRLADVASDWDRLNAARLDLPFLSAASLCAALSAFGSGNERLFIGRQGTRVVAMLLLTPQGRLRWATFQPSQIPLGAWVAEPGLDLATITRSLLQGPLRWCLALSITQIDPLVETRHEDGASTQHSDYIETGWVEVEGSFADYWAARGKNLRQNLRKQRNKLAADGITTRLRVLTTAEDMVPALARYGALESAGWKAARGTSIHPDNAQGRFYTRLFVESAGRGEAVVYEYLFDDRTVAMNLCLLRDGVLVVLKTSYDESIKLFSPASLLREEELQSFFGEGRIRRVEYYGRLMEWHTKLTDRKRTLHHLTVYRWPLLKRLAERRRAAALAAPSDAEPSPSAEAA
jgi:CelD/BcsL family acetyltransferase involved in cellulose biosynthesis